MTTPLGGDAIWSDGYAYTSSNEAEREFLARGVCGDPQCDTRPSQSAAPQLARRAEKNVLAISGVNS